MRLSLLPAVALVVLLPALVTAHESGSGGATADALNASSVWRAENRLDLAEEALWAALREGSDPRLWVELAEVAVGQRRPHAARSLLEEVPPETRGYADLVGGLPPTPTAEGLQEAYALRASGKWDEAEWALRAVVDGPDVFLELAYIAQAQGRVLRARRYFEMAADGADPALAAQAVAEAAVLPQSLATPVYERARDLRETGDTRKAEQLLRALLPFEDPQRVALELGWTAVVSGDQASAVAWLMDATSGGDESLATAAAEQLTALGPLALTEGVALRSRAEFGLAEEAFERARALGIDDQIVDMEIAYTLLDADRLEEAEPLLAAAAGGSGPDIASRAEELRSEVSALVRDRLMLPVRALRGEGKWSMAIRALEEAKEKGADLCMVALERGYLEAEQGNPAKARRALKEAAKCDENDQVRDAARRLLRSRYHLFWGDLYVELFGWDQFAPSSNRFRNLVPVVRARGYLHPIPKVDLDPYVFAQVSRDVASRGRTTTGFPQIFTDNSAMFGVGLLVRGWKRRVGIYAQIGPAINLLDDGRDRVSLDARVAAFFAVTTPTCYPTPQMTGSGVRALFAGCAESYAEAVWVSRFDHNVITVGRGRIGFTALVTGPVAWQPIAELRVFKDINDDFWNNLIDAGAGIRWRLLMPFGLDVMLGVHGGSFFGLENVDPAPDPLHYAELRLLLTTYVEL